MKKYFLLFLIALCLTVCSSAQQTQPIHTNTSGFTYRGAWQASTAYHVNDILVFNNSTYEVSVAFTSGSSFDSTKVNLWVTVPTNLTVTTLSVGTLTGTGTGNWFLQGPCLSSTPVTPTTGPIIYCDANNGNQISVKNTNGTVTVLGAGGGSGISLTTSGTGGAATLSGSVLNIPAFTAANIVTTLGFTPLSANSTAVSFATGAIVNIPGSGKFTAHQLVADTLFSTDLTTQIQNLGAGTVNVSATNFNWNSSPLATQTYVNNQIAAAGTGGGGGGIPYTSPVTNFLPVASVSGGVTSFINSHFRDDGNNTYDSEPFLLTNAQYLQPSNTATSSANYQSNISYYQLSYWNASSVPVATGWQQYAFVGSGTSPSTTLDFFGPPDLPNDSVLFGTNAAILATSGVNYGTPKFKLRGATWNGSASVLDDWNIQGVQGTGSNPTSTLTFSHVGTSGTASVQFQSAVSVSSGTPGINNGGAQWTGGTALPATCNIGDLYNLTNATSVGASMQVCYPANTWNQFGTGSGSGSSMSGTPTFVADAGAGTSPSVSFVSGYNDGSGFVNLTEGTSPTAAVGIITIHFGGSYATTPKCTAVASNAATVALAGGTYVPSGTSNTTQFVINDGPTALTAGTVYQWLYRCGL